MVRWVERAGFWWRAAAGATDLLAALALGVIVVMDLKTPGSGQNIQTSPLGGVWCALWLLYSSTETFFAGTPGRLLLGQRIARQNGLRADRWRLFLRWSTKQSPAIVGLVGTMLPNVAFTMLQSFLLWVLAIGLLGILHEDRLSWHDEWSGTAVWRTRRIAPPPLPHVPPPASAMSR
ncbi:MAG: hypothetical protein JWL69_2090 [Phycisphaerales bacterium]|jgi:uncharacterized RDD family membrane protein YckC|nr:hypothetical protein [Phycisphaerales bacterium]MDB5354338.1 hypothetical protein [Phycisphaerales bacterium]